MNFFTTLFQAAVTSTPAQEAITNTTEVAQEVAQKAPNPMSSIGLLILMFLVFYLLLIRPNQKKERKRREEIASIQEGDKVITSGGIKATVVSIKDDTITIDSKGTKLEILKVAIARVMK